MNQCFYFLGDCSIRCSVQFLGDHFEINLSWNAKPGKAREEVDKKDKFRVLGTRVCDCEGEGRGGGGGGSREATSSKLPLENFQHKTYKDIFWWILRI
jgi:hypothetical protein